MCSSDLFGGLEGVTAAALEDSGDYVEPLHARAVLLPKDGQAGRLASARNGEHAELEGENEWKRARKTVGDASLLSQRPDSPEVLSKEGKADEDKALKTDISALVDATQHKDVKQYDGMLKAADLVSLSGYSNATVTVCERVLKANVPVGTREFNMSADTPLSDFTHILIFAACLQTC